MDALGRHLMIELWDCNASINQPDAVRAAIEAGSAKLGPRS